MKKLITLAFVTMFTTTLFAQDENTFVKVGDNAPEFSFDAENGITKNLSELKGKVVFINFFATWCPPCRMELPHVQKEIYEVYKNKEDFVLMIIGREQDWETINKFKKEQNFTMPFYPDLNRKIYSKFAKQSIPRNFVIDREGKIVYSAIGYTEEEFENLKAVIADQFR